MDSDYYDKEFHVNIYDFHEMKKISTALDILITKIKADNHSECVNTAASFYDMAYRRGYEAGFKDGKKEGRVKVKTVYETVDPNEDWGDFKG